MCFLGKPNSFCVTCKGCKGSYGASGCVGPCQGVYGWEVREARGCTGA